MTQMAQPFSLAGPVAREIPLFNLVTGLDEFSSKEMMQHLLFLPLLLNRL
jgi:hypothetical protein